MSEPRDFATLSPRLLARKGTARPAMRRPDGLPDQQVADQEALAHGAADDLGWNDWGEGHDPQAHGSAQTGEPAAFHDVAREVPEVLRQIERLATRINRKSAAPARLALQEGRRAAFTLRLEAERHFRLKMAGLVLNRSAQDIVTEALDSYLSQIPEISSLSGSPRKRR